VTISRTTCHPKNKQGLKAACSGQNQKPTCLAIAWLQTLGQLCSQLGILLQCLLLLSSSTWCPLLRSARIFEALDQMAAERVTGRVSGA